MHYFVMNYILSSSYKLEISEPELISGSKHLHTNDINSKSWARRSTSLVHILTIG